MLREAIDAEPKLAEPMKTDPELKGLFNRPEFKELRVIFFPSLF